MCVWIETRLRGIPASAHPVTPYMGVWIETHQFTNVPSLRFVTPYMGVWIETPEINLSHSLKTYRVSSLRSNFNSLF